MQAGKKTSKFLEPRQNMAANRGNIDPQSDIDALKGQTERRAEDKAMKKRWMKSVIETSKQDTPALPFQRSMKHKPRPASLSLAKVKSA